MNRTLISWTDFTSSPLRYRDENGKTVWACVHASDGCRFCYAESLALRFRRGQEFEARNMRGLTPYLDAAEMHRLATSPAISGKKVFLNDMTDWLGEWVPDDLVGQMFALMTLRTDVTWQCLTKRAERQRQVVTNLTALFPANRDHIWLGVSAEDQANADARIPLLLQTPAAVRFVSVEPMLGPVDLATWLRVHCVICGAWTTRNAVPVRVEGPKCCGVPVVPRLDWIICGGESGPHYRRMDPQWAADLVEQCVAAGVAVFLKQFGGLRPGGQALLDGVEYHEWPEDTDAVQRPVESKSRRARTESEI
jgi:protein gp37